MTDEQLARFKEWLGRNANIDLGPMLRGDADDYALFLAEDANRRVAKYAVRFVHGGSDEVLIFLHDDLGKVIATGALNRAGKAGLLRYLASSEPSPLFKNI